MQDKESATTLLKSYVIPCHIQKYFFIYSAIMGHKWWHIFQEEKPNSYKVNWDKFYEDFFSPKFKYESIRKTPDPNKELNKLLSLKIKRKKSFEIENSNSNFTHKIRHNSFITSKNQYCVVKMNYGTDTNSHRRYLNTYMVQKNKKDIKEKPEVFGNISSEEYNEVRKKTSTGFKNKKSLHFKFIISPEKQLNPVELKAFTQVLIKQMENDTGFKFDWQAAVHTNTEHNHIHILINGVDQTGKKIRFLVRCKGFIRRKIKEKISYLAR